jgi:tetratricopeptide (TPR) repeat protein
MTPRACALFLLCATFTVTLRASAEERDIDHRAKAQLDRGVSAYEEGNYDEAIAAFREGHAIDPHPTLLYAWAQAERKSGRCERARELYAEFLKGPISTAQRAAAEENAARCEPAPPPAEPGPTPAPGANRAGTPPIHGTQEPRAPSPAREPRPERALPGAPVPFYLDVPGDLLALSGLTALAVGTGFFVSVSEREKDLERGATGRSYGSHADRLEGVKRDRVIAISTIGGGAALLGSGVLRYLLRDSAPEGTTLDAALTPDTAALVARGWF